MVERNFCALCGSLRACVKVDDVGYVCGECVKEHADAHERRQVGQPRLIAKVDGAGWFDDGTVMFVEIGGGE